MDHFHSPETHHQRKRRQFPERFGKSKDAQSNGVEYVINWLYIRPPLTSVILGMAFCSTKTESWTSTRTSPGSTLSPGIPSWKLRSWPAGYFLPESKRKWSLSFLKKSWNPSCTQSTTKSLNLESSSKFSSRSWPKSCHTGYQAKVQLRKQFTRN